MRITAVDPEGGDVTYPLTGADAGLLDADVSNGQVKTKMYLKHQMWDAVIGGRLTLRASCGAVF